MREEGFGDAIGHRTAGTAAAAAHAHPAGLHKHVQRAFAGGHAADFLDIGAGHRLVVGDDRQRLQRRPRQLLLLHRLAAEQERQITGGAEHPLARHLHQSDAALGIGFLHVAQESGNVGAFRQAAGNLGRRQGLGGGEEQGLDHTQVLPSFLGALVHRGRIVVDRDYHGGARISHFRSPE